MAKEGSIAKDTFWNKLREKNGWSLKYIAKKTGIPQSTLGNWFSGNKAPRNERHIRQLCELFEIPFDKGYNAFYHAEKGWDSTQKTQHYYNTYWNDLKERNNLSIKDISEMTGITPVTISSNFSGRYKPNLTNLEKYCKLFEIPIEEGKAQFKKAHEDFLAIQRGETPESTVQEVKDSEIKTPPKDESTIDYSFWPSLFANSMFSTKDIAKYLNVTEDKVAKYFTGESTPNFNQLRMICGLYGGVDMTTGKTAFNLLHEHFLSSEPEDEVAVELPVDDVVNKTLKLFYNEASYEEFIELQKLIRDKDVRALKMVYSIVDYDTYTALELIVGK